MRIALIGCSKTKNDKICKTADMYKGELFKKALLLCQKLRYDEIYVLSAKHGLLQLTDAIEPYEETLNKAGKEKMKIWADKVIKQLNARIMPDDELIFYCGRNYYKYLEKEIHNKKYFPLKGLGMGRQLQYLKEALKQ